MRWLPSVGSKTLHQQNPPFLNWKCWLTQADLYNGHKTAALVLAVNLHCGPMPLCHTLALMKIKCVMGQLRDDFHLRW